MAGWNWCFHLHKIQGDIIKNVKKYQNQHRNGAIHTESSPLLAISLFAVPTKRVSQAYACNRHKTDHTSKFLLDKTYLCRVFLKFVRAIITNYS